MENVNNVAVTLADIIANAKAMGKAFADGKLATGTTIDSARMRAIIPAMKAIEAKGVKLEATLPHDITMAYAEGAGIAYSDASKKAAISKTANYLVASDRGRGMTILREIDRLIRETNESDKQKRMATRVFEKVTSIMRIAKDRDVTPADIMPVLDPAKLEETMDAKLAKLFEAAAELMRKAAETSSKYEGLAVEGVRFDRLAKEHETRDKRNKEGVQPIANQMVAPPEVKAVVTPGVTDGALHGDDVDMALDAMLA